MTSVPKMTARLATKSRRCNTALKKVNPATPRDGPKKPTFLDDAVSILGAPVSGQAKGKQIKLPMAEAMFRRLCREALGDNNAALRKVIDLVLVLEPEALQEAKQNSEAGDEARRKFARMAGLDPDEVYVRPKEPDPRMQEIAKRATELANEERKRLVRQAKERGNLCTAPKSSPICCCFRGSRAWRSHGLRQLRRRDHLLRHFGQHGMTGEAIAQREQTRKTA